MKKTGFLGTTYYTGKHFEIVNGVKTKHIFAGGMRIAQISGGTRYYHHKDHLGSTTGVTNDAGTLVWKADYEPYGLQRGDEQTGMDSLIRHRFTDQEYDAETRLYNYNARLYDPSIARFISPDTIVDNPYSSLALNRYLYVAGNPLRYTDPSGHIKFGKFFKRAVGSSVSTVMDDWMGIEYAGGGYFNVVGAEVGFDFRNNGVEMSVGVGTGEGWYVSVGTPSCDFSAGKGYWATVGYDTRGGMYASASYNGVSARYYLRSGYYSGGVGASFGSVGVNVGYARGGGVSVGGGINGFGASYNLKAGRLRGKVDVTTYVVRGSALAKQAENETARQILDDNMSMGSIHNGAADAWRHARWNELMAQEFGAVMALAVSVGHEIFQNGYSQPFSEFKMDMHNNYVGAFSGQDASTLLYSGSLTILDQGYSGSY